MRQRESLPPSVSRSLVASPVKWPQNSVGMVHPAVFPSFKTPEPVSSTAVVDLPPGAYSMIINKPSLFLLGFGLMLLGVCFFSSGFFLGMWMGGKSAGESSAQVASSGGGGSSAGGSGGASTSRFGTLLGLAGTAVGGKAGRMAFAGQRAANKEARQQARAGGGGGGGGSMASTGGGSVNRGGGSSGTTETDFSGEESFDEDGNVGPSSNVTYAIQLGSFATKENAQDLITRLKEAQFSTYLVESKDTDGGSTFCVRFGNFNRFVLAETAIGNFSDQGISAIVVAVKSTDKRLMR